MVYTIHRGFGNALWNWLYHITVSEFLPCQTWYEPQPQGPEFIPFLQHRARPGRRVPNSSAVVDVSTRVRLTARSGRWERSTVSVEAIITMAQQKASKKHQKTIAVSFFPTKNHQTFRCDLVEEFQLIAEIGREITQHFQVEFQDSCFGRPPTSVAFLLSWFQCTSAPSSRRGSLASIYGRIHAIHVSSRREAKPISMSLNPRRQTYRPITRGTLTCSFHMLEQV